MKNFRLLIGIISVVASLLKLQTKKGSPLRARKTLSFIL